MQIQASTTIMENYDQTAVYVAIQGLQSTNKIKFESCFPCYYSSSSSLAVPFTLTSSLVT
jgi:hypothetical protein